MLSNGFHVRPVRRQVSSQMLLVPKGDFDEAIPIRSIDIAMEQRGLPVRSPVEVVPSVADGCGVPVDEACDQGDVLCLIMELEFLGGKRGKAVAGDSE